MPRVVLREITSDENRRSAMGVRLAPGQERYVDTVDEMSRMTEATLRSMPGFLGGRVFLSEDGESVVSLVEWRDRESFAEFRRSGLGRSGTHVLGELRPKAYWLRPHATVEAE